jgi:hypothetical protein
VQGSRNGGDSPAGGVEAATDALLREAHIAAPHEVPALATRHVRAFGGLSAAFFLADLQQQTLIPFVGPAEAGVDEHVEALLIDATLAGRAFQQVEVMIGQHASPDGRATIWLPLLDGTERLGVLAVKVENANEYALGNALD